MNDVIKRYRARRKKRLDARGYRADEEIEWITVNGTHIPLEDGKAVGGPMEGREFENAKSENAERARKTQKRKQKEVPDGFLDDWGKVRNKYVEEFNERAEKSIMEETGYSANEAKKFHETLLHYLGDNFAEYSKGGHKKDVETVDEGLSRMGAYDGEIYRGMYFDTSQRASFKKFADAEVGDEIKMRTLSSWSSDKWVAEDFANFQGDHINSVIITCKNNKTGVGVQHISKFAKSESEVLAPSTARWKVTGKRAMNKYEFLKEFRKDNPRGLADLETKFKKEQYQSVKIIFIEVEEI